MSIVVSNVEKLYGEQKALSGVSFEIPTGQIVGFLGPNGAGKSTMMKILTCFLPPSEGTAEVCGFDVLNAPMKVRDRVGYLPEHNPLYLDMYVKEYLKFIGEVHKIPNLKSRVTEMIELVGLTKEQHKKIGDLSKGYRQRVGLAQAIIHDPEVLILDEPTSGLDPNQLEEIRSLIKNIGKKKTVLLSTHIMQEVEAICDRVMIINNGTIVADGIAADLKKMLGDQKIISVEFEGEIDLSKLEKLTGVQSVQDKGNHHYNVLFKGEHDLRKEIAATAQKNNWLVLAIRLEERSMEEVFKSLTKK